MAVLSLRVSDRLVLRFGAQPTLVAGTLVTAVSLALFTQAPVDGSYAVHLLPGLLLLGLGMGAAFPALMSLAMSDSSPSDAGLASGLVNTTAEAGGALGLAVLATLAAARSDQLVAGGASTASALTDGYHLAFWVAAGLVAAAAGVAATVLRPQRAGADELPRTEDDVCVPCAA
jgi:MFS family permease